MARNPEALIVLLLAFLCASAFVPAIRLDARSATDQVAIGTAATLVATLASVLFFDRAWRHLRLRDLLLACALATIAISSVCAGVLLSSHVRVDGHSAAWLVLGGRLAAWTLIAGAAAAGERRMLHHEPGAVRVQLARAALASCAVILAVVIAATLSSAGSVPGEPLGNHTAALAAQILMLALAAGSALAFRAEANRGGDPTARLLALASALAAAAALSYCAMPALYTSHVVIGDLLRAGALGVLLLAVCLEWSADERRSRAAALARERRRMAADVHDLIMQDLSFALSNARTLAEDPDAGAVEASTVVLAGERALAGARDVLTGLTGLESRPIAEALETVTKSAARHTPLRFDAEHVPDSAQVPDEPTRDALVHIAREAVTNAVKHARAGTVQVTLAYAGEWRLCVCDDGRGFDASGDGEGFGLASMRQHAHALGGELRVSSERGQGAVVEAVLP